MTDEAKKNKKTKLIPKSQKKNKKDLDKKSKNTSRLISILKAKPTSHIGKKRNKKVELLTPIKDSNKKVHFNENTKTFLVKSYKQYNKEIPYGKRCCVIF
jgi:hypothetical protein